MVCRCDTYGVFLWSGTKWVNLITENSMPVGTYVPDPYNHGWAGYEIVIAPNNPNHLYMNTGGTVWYSTNKGSNWTKGIGYGPITGYIDTSTNITGPYMVDPINDRSAPVRREMGYGRP
jgi:hypothetical protein